MYVFIISYRLICWTAVTEINFSSEWITESILSVISFKNNNIQKGMKHHCTLLWLCLELFCQCQKTTILTRLCLKSNLILTCLYLGETALLLVWYCLTLSYVTKITKTHSGAFFCLYTFNFGGTFALSNCSFQNLLARPVNQPLIGHL